MSRHRRTAAALNYFHIVQQSNSTTFMNLALAILENTDQKKNKKMTCP